MARLLQSESHIVVVDSRPTDYRDLTSLAGERQWHVHFLTTARAAITFIRRARADLWMINAWLPDMSGLTFHEILREQLCGASALIISDEYDSGDERRACCNGAVLYVCKGPSHSIDCRPLLELLANSRANSAPPAGQLVESVVRRVTDRASPPIENTPCSN